MVDPQWTAIVSSRKAHLIAIRRSIQDPLQIVDIRRDQNLRRRCTRGEAGGDEHRQSDLPDMAYGPHRQAFCGATSMRPRISMCMAWQNQVQKYQ